MHEVRSLFSLFNQTYCFARGACMQDRQLTKRGQLRISLRSRIKRFLLSSIMELNLFPSSQGRVPESCTLPALDGVAAGAVGAEPGFDMIGSSGFLEIG